MLGWVGPLDSQAKRPRLAVVVLFFYMKNGHDTKQVEQPVVEGRNELKRRFFIVAAGAVWAKYLLLVRRNRMQCGLGLKLT